MSLLSETVETIKLTGKDKFDLDKQQWDWRNATDVFIVKQHPDELLPMVMSARPRFSKIEAVDRFSRRIDYYRRK